LEIIFQDLRYAFRQFGKNRAFTAVAVFTLALGIGANTAIFSIVDSILLQPLPFSHQERLVQVQAASPFPKGWVREYQRRAQSFSAVSGYTFNAEYNVSREGTSDRAFGSTVSTNLFDTLQVRPLVGRFFTPDEERAGADNVVVLSHSYWQQHFGEDPGVMGRTVLIDGVSRQIIGVALKGIYFPNPETQFWIPIAFKAGDPIDAWQDSDNFNKRAIGRLKDGVSAAQAQAELRTAQPQMLTLFPWRMPDNWAADVAVTPLLKSVVGDTGSKLLLLLGAVGLVLLIACANVANLMLARAASRQREMALRSALGATAPRLVRQLLTESAVLGLIAGTVGLVFALAGLRLLKVVLPADTPRLATVALHPDVLWFALVISLVTGLLSGLAPAWNAGKEDLQTSLRSTSTSTLGGSGRFLISKVLAIGQIALAVVVITAAGVMLRSLQRLASVDPGFRTDRTISAHVSLDRTACQQAGRCAAFFQSLLERAQSMPGIQSAALADNLPLTGADENFVFDAQDHPREARQEANVASGRVVSASYFELMGIRLMRGRLFTRADESAASRAVVINLSLAKRLWPNQDPIGKSVIAVDKEPSPGVMDPKSAAMIVGVVSDTRHESLATEAGGEVYLPVSATNEKPVMTIVLRSSASASEVATNLRALVREMNPAVPVTRVTTLDDVVASSTASPRSLAMLLLSLGVLAVSVGALGVYSLISYTVSWRTREIGLRMALGANRSQIALLIVRQSLSLATAGSALGLLAAAGSVTVLRSFLYQTSPADPLTYGAVLLLISGLAIVAAWAPARRAANVDPMRALRME
jgi:predicted permease